MQTRWMSGWLPAVLVLAVGACGSSGAPAPPERVATPITEVRHDGGTLITFSVGCARDLDVTLVAERDDAVVLSATHLRPAPDEESPACLQPFYVELDAPLADREVLDQDGNVIHDVMQVPDVSPEGATLVERR